MTEDNGADLLTGALRRMAEERALAQPVKLGAGTTPEEVNRLLHDLRVHQIELEMQNDELRRGQLKLDSARALYFDLYDLAPVGYLTLDAEWLIREANLTAAKLFGVARTVLAKQALTHYIFPEDQDVFYRLRQRLAKQGEPQNCELRMIRADAGVFWVQLQLISVEGVITGLPYAISPNASAWRTRYVRPRSWRPSAPWPAVLPMILTIS